MQSMSKKNILTGIILGTALAVTGVIAVFADKPVVDAGEKPPIVTMVENHEGRIGDLEVKTDNIENQVNQNSSDINDVKNNHKPGQTVVEKIVTVVEKPAPLEPGDYPVTPNDPAPVPEPVVDPWTITGIDMRYSYILPNGSPINPDYKQKVCTYTFYSGETWYMANSVPLDSTSTCNSGAVQVGLVIPSSLKQYLLQGQYPY